MKQLIILNLILLALVGINVRASTPVPVPTPPVTPSVIREKAAPPAKTVTFSCPDKISVAPAPIPSGWQSLGNVIRRIQGVDLDTQKHMIVCWYGVAGDTNFGASSLIGQSFPADYQCKISGPGVFVAICNKKIRINR